MDVLSFLRINIKPMKYKVTGLESVACGLETRDLAVQPCIRRTIKTMSMLMVVITIIMN